MIGYLRGRSDGAGVILTAGGVGYEVACVRAPAAGEDVEVHVHTTVRDGAMSLYGFGTTVERDVFRSLCAVTGVGPQMAMSLLRDVGVAGIAGAVAAGTPAPLTAAAGVGKKLAERIVALAKIDASLATEDPEAPAAEAGIADEVAATLVELGFSAAEATTAAAAAVAVHGEDSSEAQLVSTALAELRKAA